jgi:Uncharacterized alpha/beta hydrolase domain (DUF2235)
VRCLAAVLGYCGVPTELKGAPIARDEASAKKLAKVAVRRVYQFTESRYEEEATKEQKQLLEKRQELAREFRTKYLSGDANRSNAEPHFIGVFDTVASLSNPEAVRTLLIFGLIVFVVLIVGCYFFGIPLWWPFLAAAAIVVIAWCASLISRIRWPSLSWIGWPPHLTEPRMNFYNLHLSNNVPHARHAISIDETRASFERVIWGGSGTTTELIQKWFAGNHGDIGGGYPDNESRLSDAALKWLVTAAKSAGLKCDDRVLNFHPDSAGRQHDETQSWKFRFAAKTSRPVKALDAPLDDSVVERFLYSAVQQHGRFLPYRPRQLRAHVRVRHHFRADYLIRRFGPNAAQKVEILISRAAQRGIMVDAFIWYKTKSEIARRST